MQATPPLASLARCVHHRMSLMLTVQLALPALRVPRPTRTVLAARAVETDGIRFLACVLSVSHHVLCRAIEAAVWIPRHAQQDLSAYNRHASVKKTALIVRPEQSVKLEGSATGAVMQEKLRTRKIRSASLVRQAQLRLPTDQLVRLA